ncbi:hypothetical protein cypCar_00039999 [Cyprinus carpio]|nr:hypothetical protein cypCar_00039999 [Cyprinus carpio]
MGIDEHREERVKNLGSLINIKLSPNTAVPRVTPAASRASNPPLSCWWKPDLLLDSNCQMRLTSRGRQMRPWQTQQGWKVGTQRMIVVQLSLTKDFYILWKAKMDTGAALIIRLPYYFILFYMKREVGHICGSDDEGPTQRDTSAPQEKCSPRPMCRPPVSSGVYKMAQSVLQKYSVSGGVKDLLSQVTNEDIIMARGCSLTPFQRPERTSHQTKTIQGLSLLATWTPKKRV